VQRHANPATWSVPRCSTVVHARNYRGANFIILDSDSKLNIEIADSWCEGDLSTAMLEIRIGIRAQKPSQA
jgi:hypothetical protein